MNIYEIQQDLLAILAEIEEADGEISDELYAKLQVTNQDFKDKVRDYTYVIKSHKAQIEEIDAEIKRLTSLKESANKIINRLTEILVDAIDKFGDTSKSNAKFVDFGLGKVLIRNTQAVEVNEEVVDKVKDFINDYVVYSKSAGLLCCVDALNLSAVARDITENNEGVTVSKDDLEGMNLDLSINIPLKDVETPNGYMLLRAIAEYNDIYKLKPGVSKTDLKNKLKDNGSATPNLAKLVTHKSLTIK